ncbi:MAG: DUF1684 domain-containing protein [Chloroflexi bacterium]|nr:DUF1684 domain-containing protein [Chloroflexota bacterium]MCI0576705.1 DUF1684 domain-containing protein [Chloroflexota bacterium]MCI0649426.1 DUF1684 domain-containing protein [Chloroflexota bacterium]MCI0730774.1 DUF1684 domain-containing protein [Chloroflexota bacterium]
MSQTPADPVALANWRRQVAELYATVRQAPPAGHQAAWRQWRARRDQLFKEHSQSPLDEAQRAAFGGLPYYDYDPAWRVTGRLEQDVPPDTRQTPLAADGDFHYTRIAYVYFTAQGVAARLSLYWVEGYGGGLFLPFQDATSGRQTYGGGRYLYDTIKGADLGTAGDELILDFNYAYHPSCVYNPQWLCPLASPENRLPFAVTAGERLGD